MTLADAGARTAAIDPTRSVCVSAPAGSGKTELLIQRFLGLLARVDYPESVLAITFTRKASAEMLERILEALNAAAAAAPVEGEHEARTRSLAAAVLLRDRALGWGLLENGNRLRVRTIDSFCAELARQMPLLSTLGGAVGVVDDAGELYREAAEGLLAGLREAPEDDPELAALLRHLDNNWERLAGLLTSLLARRDQWFGYLGAHREPGASEASLRHALRALTEDMLAELEACFAPHAAVLDPLLAWRHDSGNGIQLRAVPGSRAAELAAWQELADVLLTKQGGWRKRVNAREGGFPGGSKVHEVAAMKAFLEDIAGQRSLAVSLGRVRLLPTPDDSGAWPLLAQLARLLPRALAQLFLVFQRRGAVDHAQMALAALDALGEDEAPTELALRLDYVIEHILVDGWAEHNAASPEAPRTVLVVGDGMQSIYGFRDANVSLFLKAREEGFNGLRLEALQLSSNFRSVAPVVDWVNARFADAFPAADDVVAGRVRYTPATTTRDGPGGVAVRLFRDEDTDATAAAEADFVAARIAAALQAAPAQSCAVLGRTRRQLQPVLARLRRAGLAVAAQDVDSLAATSVIRDLLVLCTALADRYDRLAWFSMLRAPWCGLRLAELLAVDQAVGGETVSGWLLGSQRIAAPLDADAAARLAAVATTLGHAEATRDRRGLRAWVESTWLALGGPGCYDEDVSATAAQFFALLERAEAEAGGLDAHWLRREVARLYAEPGNPRAPVQVMTLHKAKGLQFDRVWILDVTAGTPGDDRELLAWDDHVTAAGERVFLLAVDDHSQGGSASLYQYLREEAKRKRALEATRLLYVGATRAVSELTLCARPHWNESREQYGDPPASSLAAALWPALLAEAEEEIVATGALAEPPARPLRRLAAPPSILQEGTPAAATAVSEAVTGGFRERCLGTAVHRVLELLGGREPLPARCGEVEERLAVFALQQAGLPPAALAGAAAEAVAHVDRTLADPNGRWVLARHPEGACELPLSAVDEAGELRQLVLDRYFREVEAGACWVVDYKTSRPAPGEARAAFLVRETALHAAQLAAYREALGALSAGPVRCALYFTALGCLQELPG
jgi:ATP-dependent exoDNAse (exonuclease V) beta subunit